MYDDSGSASPDDAKLQRWSHSGAPREISRGEARAEGAGCRVRGLVVVEGVVQERRSVGGEVSDGPSGLPTVVLTAHGLRRFVSFTILCAGVDYKCWRPFTSLRDEDLKMGWW